MKASKCYPRILFILSPPVLPRVVSSPIMEYLHTQENLCYKNCPNGKGEMDQGIFSELQTK